MDNNDEILRIIEKVKKESDPFTKAKLINFLHREKNFTLKKLAEILHCQKSYFSQLKRLLKLPEILIDGYYSKTISLSHLIIISRLKDNKEMINVYEKVLANNLSTNKTEELVREKIYQIRSNGKRAEPKIIENIKKKFKKIDKEVEVKIIQTRIKAKVILEIKGDLRKTSFFLEKISFD